jgi:hypothetical protein
MTITEASPNKEHTTINKADYLFRLIEPHLNLGKIIDERNIQEFYAHLERTDASKDTETVEKVAYKIAAVLAQIYTEKLALGDKREARKFIKDIIHQRLTDVDLAGKIMTILAYRHQIELRGFFHRGYDVAAILTGNGPKNLIKGPFHK